jgi:transcriptional regulator with XRE-family HTH domain
MKVIITSLSLEISQEVMYISLMQTLMELGGAVAAKRKALRLSQSEVASRTGLTRETLVRFERGQLTEFGSRKLLAVLAVLGMELSFIEAGMTGTLDELRRERSGV